jgi:FlaA1/EpsC-like NDP-sugar epimerase
MKNSFDLYSRANQIILDGCAFAGAFLAAYLIRFDGWPSGFDARQMLIWLPILVAARLSVYVGLGIYRRVWKFVSFSDATEIAKSIAIMSGLLLILRFVVPGNGNVANWVRIPTSVIALEGLLSLLGSLGVRGLRRAQYSRQRRLANASGGLTQRVLLYGAGRAGIMLLKELETNRSVDVIGFVDDDPKKVGSVINSVRVVGNGDDLATVAASLRPDEVIVSMATASAATLARALAKCRRAQVPAKIIPSLQEILTGRVKISQLRETQMEDILGRESVEVVDFKKVAGAAYYGKRVLVTGAGGSIGSELVRQLLRLEPASVAILDKDENSVYELEQELRMKQPSAVLLPQIGDVRDGNRLRALFAQFRPQLVFHAAAHKHVPLMETHPCEAVLNNVLGTRNVLDLAEEFGVERFVFISSDKAVNPLNVMGATKRLGEMMVQVSSTARRTRCACVRFGNVLGSRGSVIPLFQKQIAAGGPVTVTHPDVTRYFMTIQEAVQLILCAGTLATGGETFVLDMGKPRNILELAREMILLSGFEPEVDIEMKITGLRPGEKLTEELVAPSEKLLPTRFEKLSVIEPRRSDERALGEYIRTLIDFARDNDSVQLHQALRAMDASVNPQPIRVRAVAASDGNGIGTWNPVSNLRTLSPGPLQMSADPAAAD